MRLPVGPRSGGPIGAPAGLGAVGDGAHQRVGDYVEEAGHQHEGGSVGNGEAEDVGEKERKCDGHHFPGNAAGSGVTQRIPYFLGEFCHKFFSSVMLLLCFADENFFYPHKGGAKKFCLLREIMP